MVAPFAVREITVGTTGFGIFAGRRERQVVGIDQAREALDSGKSATLRVVGQEQAQQLFETLRDRVGSIQLAKAVQEIQRFYSADAGRFARLQGFDSAAQQEWLKNNFPLLDRETFASTAQREGRRQRESISGRNHLDTAERVQERKHQQYKLLLEMAQGTRNSFGFQSRPFQ